MSATLDDVCKRIIVIWKKKEFSTEEFTEEFQNSKMGKGYINQYNHSHPDDTRDFCLEQLIDIISFKCSKCPKSLSNIKKNFLSLFKFPLYEPINVQYTSWVIFGCPKSTDIDIFVFLNWDNPKEYQIIIDDLKNHLGNYIVDISNIVSELNALYPDRDIDVNYGFQDDRGNISTCVKGQNWFSQNIIFHTYHHHKQIHSNLITNTIEIPESAKNSLQICQFLMYEKIVIILLGVERYNELRGIRREAGADREKRLIHSHFVLTEGMKGLDLCSLSLKMASVMKSLLMKIIQTCQIMNNSPLLFTKDELADDSKQWFTYPEGIRWFLMRGREGCIEQAKLSLPEIVDVYKHLIDSEIHINWNICKLSIDVNPTGLPIELYKLFLASVNEPSDTFIDLWRRTYGDTITGVFIEKSSDYLSIPEWIRTQIIDCNQRSPEWQKLLTFYKCGKNTGLQEVPLDRFIFERYNLIRGCIGESLAFQHLENHIGPIMNTYSLSGYTLFNIGLIVKELHEGSLGAAPDFLLINDSEKDIICGEIKTLKGPFKNSSDYRRDVDLATKQCKKVRDITEYCSKGLLIFIYYNDTGWDFYHHLFEMN